MATEWVCTLVLRSTQGDISAAQLTANRIHEVEVDPEHARRVGEFFRAHGFRVVRSHEIAYTLYGDRSRFETVFGAFGPQVPRSEPQDGASLQLSLSRLPPSIRACLVSASFADIDFGPVDMG